MNQQDHVGLAMKCMNTYLNKMDQYAKDVNENLMISVILNWIIIHHAQMVELIILAIVFFYVDPATNSKAIDLHYLV